MTEFKSQICTTVEQSKRLLGLGLKPGTADMTWKFSYLLKGVPQYDCLAESTWDKVTMKRYEQHCFYMNLHAHWKRPDGTQMSSEEVYAEITKKDIPAWSLHRLVELIWGDGEHDMSLETHRPFEDCIERIDYMINQSHCFNKEYLV
jgi:hypothetical protein